MARVLLVFDDIPSETDINLVGVQFRAEFDPILVDPENLTPAQSEALVLLQMYDEYIRKYRGAEVVIESSIHGNQQSVSEVE